MFLILIRHMISLLPLKFKYLVSNFKKHLRLVGLLMELKEHSTKECPCF